MLQLITGITIGELFFDYVHEATIRSSWRNLTATATIKLPRNLFTRDNQRIDEVIAVGQQIKITAGYDGNAVERFAGYVSELNAATQVVEVKCEDEMWKLKQSSLTKSWANANVEDVVKYIKQQTGSSWSYEILGSRVQIGTFKVEKLNAAKVLLKLKDDYGIHCFFRNGKLIIGKPYEPVESKRTIVKFEYGLNIIAWRNLIYKKASDVRLKAKAINHLPDGKTKEVVVGDTDGEESTLDFYNLADSELKPRAEELLERMKYDGYRGSFPAFGEPVVNHGDVAEIYDWRYPQRSGQYWIDNVETTITVSSIKQQVEIGPIANIGAIGG